MANPNTFQIMLMSLLNHKTYLVLPISSMIQWRASTSQSKESLLVEATVEAMCGQSRLKEGQLHSVFHQRKRPMQRISFIQLMALLRINPNTRKCTREHIVTIFLENKDSVSMTGRQTPWFRVALTHTVSVSVSNGYLTALLKLYMLRESKVHTQKQLL